MKRRTDGADPGQKRVCIIHREDVSNKSEFIFLGEGDKRETRVNHLRHVKEIRLQVPAGNPYQQMSICNQMPEDITEECGYHRTCYQSFTGEDNIIQSMKLITA